MAVKYVFVTGGVVSGLGKGITAASLGRLLKARGYTVTMQKFDPYINIAPASSGDTTPDDTGTVDSGSDAGGAVAAVLMGGAAVWGGYEITTRAILKNLLPADAAIPKTQGQLAELLWQNAGCPQPTVAQATDAAAAARWCVEQGYLEEDFAPEKYVPKYKVIRILKQAKSDT